MGGSVHSIPSLRRQEYHVMDGVICDAVSKTGARRVFAAYFSVKKFCFLSSLVKERSGSSLVKERHLGLNMPRSGRDKKWRNALKELEARGEEAYERKDYAEAISHFSNASNLNPKEMALIYKIGKIHLEQENYAEGISSFSKAINVGKEQGKKLFGWIFQPESGSWNRVIETYFCFSDIHF